MRPHHILLALLATSGAAFTQTDVAIVASAAASSSDCRFTEPQAKLMATGLFSSVDIINVTQSTPALADLLPYEACICWTDQNPASSIAWGNVMADYVDAGGGVVVAVQANSASATGMNLAGRWATDGYEVIVAQSGNLTGIAGLGNVLVPGHPVMSGVTTFDGGPVGTRPNGTALTAGSTLIAEWTDGRVLVAEGANPKRVDLGFFPPSSDCVSSSWISSTDGSKMIANAVAYVAGGGGPGTPYCFGNFADGNFCPCGNDNDGTEPKGGCLHDDSPAGARLFALGTASITGDTLRLLGSRGPISNSTLFFQANNNLDGFGSYLGDGIRCAGGGLIRLKVKLTDANGDADSTPAVISARSASFGHVIVPGETLYYQWWIRDSNNSPCGAESNTSNGMQIVWQP